MKGSKKQLKQSKKQPPESGAPPSGVDFGQLERLLAFMSQHGLEEFEYERGGLRIRLKKAASVQSAQQGLMPPTGAAVAASPLQAPVAASPAVAPSAGQTAPPAAAPPSDEHIIKSPIVGTFYAAANPESAPFVKAGDAVKAGQTVCIIEAMKLMNEIEADIGGEILRVLVENGQPVEYGEPLFALKPAGKSK